MSWNDNSYVYVLVRNDLTAEQQIVQGCHASLEAGFSFNAPEKTAHLVMLSVSGEDELVSVKDELMDGWGVSSEIFFEPDYNLGYTALATEPIKGSKRNALRKFKLWKSG